MYQAPERAKVHNVVLFEYENMAMKDNQNEVARDMWVEPASYSCQRG